MNHDDVIRLAKEAGLYVGKNASGVTLVGHKYQKFDNTGMLVHMDVEDMARFAELVAAAEREACALEVERARIPWTAESVTDYLAAEIRARGGGRMNERIRELIAQATKVVEPNDPDYRHEIFDKEKFAELIVQECCSMVNAYVQHNNPHDCLLVLDIKEHFGVEE